MNFFGCCCCCFSTSVPISRMLSIYHQYSLLSLNDEHFRDDNRQSIKCMIFIIDWNMKIEWICLKNLEVTLCYRPKSGVDYSQVLSTAIYDVRCIQKLHFYHPSLYTLSNQSTNLFLILSPINSEIMTISNASIRWADPSNS